MQNATQLIVVDPKSKEEINVTPLFDALHKFDSSGNAPLTMGARDAIRRIMKILNLTVHDRDLWSANDLADAYHDLHSLEDMFAALQDISSDTKPMPGLKAGTTDPVLDAVQV